MNITFLTGEYPPMQGGIADYTANLAAHLPHFQVTPVVLTSRRWPGSAEVTTPVYPTLPNWGWRSWFYIRHHLNHYRPDILHIQYQAAMYDLGGWVNWLPWYLKRRGQKTGLVTTFHDLRVPYIFPKVGRFRWWSMLALARYSNAIICTNREDIARLKEHGIGVKNPQKIYLIRLGNNVTPQPPPDFERVVWRRQYQADESTLLLAYFGFLNESKGGEELITALGLLRQQGINARLLFIGGEVGDADPTNAAYARQIQHLIKQKSLTAYVHRTGYVSPREVSANLLAADAVVLPYRDGVSFRRTTLIAALRHGCPIVSTKPRESTLLPEVIAGKTMLLAQRHDAVNLAQTIARLAQNLPLRQQLSIASTELGNMFDWPQIGQKTARVYQQLRNRN
ncbi:glycosyltransferase family 4 protein [Anaerolineales bacterium HSG24]|nr:glycosyltransferase family 4 protein [Anaerolineales bacterium HSG24]